MSSTIYFPTDDHQVKVINWYHSISHFPLLHPIITFCMLTSSLSASTTDSTSRILSSNVECDSSRLVRRLTSRANSSLSCKELMITNTKTDQGGSWSYIDKKKELFWSLHGFSSFWERLKLAVGILNGSVAWWFNLLFSRPLTLHKFHGRHVQMVNNNNNNNVPRLIALYTTSQTALQLIPLPI